VLGWRRRPRLARTSTTSSLPARGGVGSRLRRGGVLPCALTQVDLETGVSGNATRTSSKAAPALQCQGEFARRFRRLQPLQCLADGDPTIAARLGSGLPASDTPLPLARMQNGVLPPARSVRWANAERKGSPAPPGAKRRRTDETQRRLSSSSVTAKSAGASVGSSRSKALRTIVSEYPLGLGRV
jgi:hypothetical protein